MKSLIIILLLTPLCACHTLKRSSSTASESTQQASKKSFSYVFQQDSSASVWYLDTDSPFYYHPDRGLWASEGHLSQRGSLRGHVLQVYTADSNFAINNMHTQVERTGVELDLWIKIALLGVPFFLLLYSIKNIAKKLRGS